MKTIQLTKGKITDKKGKIYIDSGLLKISNKRKIPGIRWSNKNNHWYVYKSETIVRIINEIYFTDFQWVPISTDINKIIYKTKPYDHQVRGVIQGLDKKYFAYLMQQGTGKTKVIIDSIMTLHRDENLTHALIVCPKTVMGSWVNEINTHGHGNFHVQRWGEKLKVPPKGFSGVKILVINVDGINTSKGYKFTYEWLLNSGVNMMVIDESTTIKNHIAQRTMRAHTLATLATYRRILTGTPIDQSPLDLYSQFYFLHPQIFYGWSYWAFRSHFAVMKDFVRPDGKIAKIVVGYQHLDELASVIAPWSYRVTKDECLDLPAKIYETREIKLGVKALKAYKEVEGSLKQSIKVDGANLSIPIALAKITKLRQICGGSVITDDNTIVDFGNAKIKECLSIIEDSSGGVIIWCQFRHEIRRLHDILTLKGIDVHEISGRVKGKDRDASIELFNKNQGVILCQNDSGQMGITLNGASTAIYFSNSYRYMNREQSEDRCHRIGQTKHVTYYDLIVPGTVDEDILQALKRKEDLATIVLTRMRGEK